MKNIAVYGGTFNPIHNGHIIALQSLQDSGYYDEIWLMPSGIPPFKPEEVHSAKHRLSMCQLIEEELSFVKLCDYEIKKDNTSYTYNTWKELSAASPDTRFHWVIGYDHIFVIEQWYAFDNLAKEIPFVIMNRSGQDRHGAKDKLERLKQVYAFNYKEVEMPSINISSTIIRERIFDEKNVYGFVPEKILDYIKTNNLYRN